MSAATVIDARFRNAIARSEWQEAQRCLPDYVRSVETRLGALLPGDDPLELLERALELLEMSRRSAVAGRAHAVRELERLKITGSYRHAGGAARAGIVELAG